MLVPKSMIENIKSVILVARHGKQSNKVSSQPSSKNLSPSNANNSNTKKSDNNDRNILKSKNQPSQSSPESDGSSDSFSSHSYQKTNITSNEDDSQNKSNINNITANDEEALPHYVGLERYQLLKKMGDGAFSQVYKALDKITKQLVAIKIVRKFELSVTQRSNILKEVAIMRNLNHPNIVKFLSFLDTRDYYFLVLELVSGGEIFHSIVKFTYFSEELSRHIIVQVAEGIRYLHKEKGVVHRDIKPENILFEPIPLIPSGKKSIITEQGETKVDEGVFIEGVGGGGIGKIKIADFGLSKILWNGDTMTPCGTVGYTAPEIVRDQRYDLSVDMWALGCVLYTILCGFPPFYDEDVQILTEKVACGYYTFLSPWWDDISNSAKDLISHLLTVDSTKRYTIDEFLAHPWCQASDSFDYQHFKENQIPLPPLSPPPTIPSSNDITFSSHNINFPSTDLSIPSSSSTLSRILGKHSTPLSASVSLKEAFDLSYAIHRMDDRRRKNNVPIEDLYSRQRFDANLSTDSEEDEDQQIQDILRGLKNSHLYSMDPSLNIGNDDSSNSSSNSSKLTTSDKKKDKSQQSSIRKGMELSLDNATLLSRRKAADIQTK